MICLFTPKHVMFISSDINMTYTGTNSTFLQMSGKERFDWSKAEGARTEKRKLYLQHDDFGIYNCPVHHCEHGGFNSKRGCSKHTNTKHAWFTFSMRNQLFNSTDTSVKKVLRTVHGLSGRKPTLEKFHTFQ